MTTDYIAAATAIANNEPAPEAPAAPVPVVAEANAAPAAPDAVTGAAVSPEADKKEVSPPADKKPEPTRVEKGLEDLAREKAAFRQEREAAKAEISEARAMRDAAQKGDAMALLAAARIPWSQAARQVLEGHGKPEAKAPAQEEVDPRDARLAALEKEIATTKERAARADLMGQLKERTTGGKYPHLAAMEAEPEALSYIEQYFKETGELPGKTLDETLEIALEAVETAKAKEAKRWEGVLTKLRPGAVVPVSKSVVPAVGAVSQLAAKTLTNNVGSGPQSSSAAPKKPRTDEEYRLAAIEALTAQ